MSTLACVLAISAYLGAAALAATPIARPVAAPVRGVVGILGFGVVAHAAALIAIAAQAGRAPLLGLGPALCFAGLALAMSLLVVEIVAAEVSLTLVAAPLAALATVAATAVGLRPAAEPEGVRGAWLVAHVALSFAGLAAFGTAAAAGVMYLLERRELKSRRFGALFRLFPPLDTLDRVNHVATVTGWLGLTLGVVLAVLYSLTYGETHTSKLVWALSTWLGVTAVALGRILGAWRARRAAILTSATFVAVVALYVAARVAGGASGAFL
jgi:ABC-type uncharacterized transport system permease subunit